MAEATIVLTLVATSIGQAFRLDNLISKLPSIRSEPSLSKRLASSLTSIALGCHQRPFRRYQRF